MAEGGTVDIWCELCRNHFDRDHFLEDGFGSHGVGSEFGPYGEMLLKASERDALAAKLEEVIELVDCEPHSWIDAEHLRLVVLDVALGEERDAS